jgi:hypothetical protein
MINTILRSVNNSLEWNFMATKNYLYTLCLVTALGGKLCASEILGIAERYRAQAEHYAQALSSSVTTSSAYSDPRASASFMEQEVRAMRARAELYGSPLAEMAEVFDTMMERCITDLATPHHYHLAPQPKSLLHFIDARMSRAAGLTMSLGASLEDGLSTATHMMATQATAATVSNPFRPVLARVISQMATAFPGSQELLQAATLEMAVNAFVLPRLCSTIAAALRISADLDGAISFRRQNLAVQMLASATPTLDSVQATALADLERERSMLKPFLDKVDEFIDALKRTGRFPS